MYRILFCYLLFASSLTAQHAVSRPAQLPTDAVKLSRGTPNTTYNRLITALYQRIDYPRVAREHGVTGAVFATCQIDDNGHLSVIKVDYRNPVSLRDNPARIPQNNVFTVTAYSVDNSQSFVGQPNKTQERRGAEALSKEVRRVLNNLPPFLPALRNGEPITETIIYMFRFNLE